MDLVTMVLACSLYTNNSIVNAMIQVGSKNKPYTVTVEDGKTSTFPNAKVASDYAISQIKQGHVVDIGLMQIPSIWLKENLINLDGVFLPCKNTAIATKVLNQAEMQCANAGDTSNECVLSTYKTGNATAGTDYAQQIISYANEHDFQTIVAAAEAKNPAGFHMIQGDAPTTAATKNAASINPSTDKTKAPDITDTGISNTINIQDPS